MFFTFAENGFMFEPLVFILLTLAAVPAGWMILVYYRRRRMLLHLAHHLHLHFVGYDRTNMLGDWAGLYLMQLGHSGRALNLIYGPWRNQQVFVFDYCFETGSSQQRTGQRRNVVLWRLDNNLPALLALQEDFFEPLGKFRSFTRFITNDTDFDHRFHLFSDHPEVALALLSPALRRALMSCRDVNWELSGPNLVFFSEKLFAAVEISRWLTRSVRCCKLLVEASTGYDNSHGNY